MRLCITISSNWQQHEKQSGRGNFLCSLENSLTCFLSCGYKERYNFDCNRRPAETLISMAKQSSEVIGFFWVRQGVRTIILTVRCCAAWFLSPFKRVKHFFLSIFSSYLVAQNSFRGEGDRLPIHLNLGGWDTSGPNSCWHPTWLWKETTGDWAPPPPSNSTETSRTDLFSFFHIHNRAVFMFISARVNRYSRCSW